MSVSDWPKLGVYRHYKGQFYLVTGVAHDSNYEGRVVVVYVPLYVKDEAGPQTAVRTLDDFNALLHTYDHSVCPGGDHCSHRFQRFAYRGDDPLHRGNHGQPTDEEFALVAARKAEK